MRTIVLVLLVALAGETGAQDKEERQSTFRDCRDCPLMAVIPQGSWLRRSPGDESSPVGEPVRVDVPGFALGVYEVTNAEFGRFIRDTGYKMRDGCYTDLDRDGVWTWDDTAIWNDLGEAFGPDLPASCIDWHAASAYVHWLGLRTGARYRLPTAAEFEYVSRAGNDGLKEQAAMEVPASRSGGRNTVRPDDGVPDAGTLMAARTICETGNVPDAALNAVSPERFTYECNDGYPDIAPVGQFIPSPFGVYDLRGNVREWLQDCHKPARDPVDHRPPVEGNCEARAIRGGFWGSDLSEAGAEDGGHEPPGALYHGAGLRVARDLDGAVIVPDWDLRVFEDVEHGVSLLYPSAYQRQHDLSGDQVFVAASPNAVPRMDLTIVSPQQFDELGQAKTYVSSLGGDSIGMAMLAPVSTTLSDGETPATRLSFNWVHLARRLELRTVMLSAVRDGHRFSVLITARLTHDWADLEKLAYTLRLQVTSHHGQETVH